MSKEAIPVRVKLISSAKAEGEAPYPMRFFSTGTLSHPRPNQYLLRYKEVMTDEGAVQGEVSDMSVLFAKDFAVMERKGCCNSMMVFRPHQRYEGHYSTPYGEMGLALFTTEMACKADGEAGSLRLKYQLYMQGTYATENELYLAYEALPKTDGKTAETVDNKL